MFSLELSYKLFETLLHINVKKRKGVREQDEKRQKGT